MASLPIETMIKMMEELPEPAQEQVVEHLRAYITEIQDEIKWDSLFEKTQSQLIAAAQRARQEIAQGRAKPMDDTQL